MGTLAFIGLGLYDEHGLCLAGLDRLKKADKLYIELYTSLMPKLSLETLEELAGKPVLLLTRRDLEEKPEATILKDAKDMDVALLVPGDPMVATTHVDLRLRAKSMGVKTEVINGVSIYSAAPAVSGLQVYKFGRTVTVPYGTLIYEPETPYDVVKENKARNLHTLVLLDVEAEKGRYMSVWEGLQYLLRIEERRRENVVGLNSLAVGLAGLGSSSPVVRADRVERLLEFSFKTLPHTLIFPGKLHFMEAEALRAFAQAPDEVLRAE